MKNEKWQYQPMQNKTPFEIRLDVMKLAKEMLDVNQQVKMETFRRELDSLEKANATENHIRAYSSIHSPTTYTNEELIKKAQELYSFINSKS